MTWLSKKNYTVQYFEMFGNRAIYSDGWYARTIHRPAWKGAPTQPLLEDPRELYNANEAYSLANNLAVQNGEKQKNCRICSLKEAERYHVLPIDDRLLDRMIASNVGRPTVMEGRTS